MLLKDWSFVRSGKYTAISGIVEGDGKFPSGKRIVTSRIVKMDFDRMVAQTRNSVYALEKADVVRIVEHTFVNSQVIGS
jgi:hypothetical protein